MAKASESGPLSGGERASSGVIYASSSVLFSDVGRIVAMPILLSSPPLKHGLHTADMARVSAIASVTGEWVKRIGWLVTARSRQPIRVKRDPRKNPPISGIAWYDSHLRRSRVNRLALVGSPWWEGSSLTAFITGVTTSIGEQARSVWCWHLSKFCIDPANSRPCNASASQDAVPKGVHHVRVWLVGPARPALLSAGIYQSREAKKGKKKCRQAVRATSGVAGDRNVSELTPERGKFCVIHGRRHPQNCQLGSTHEANGKKDCLRKVNYVREREREREEREREREHDKEETHPVSHSGLAAPRNGWRTVDECGPCVVGVARRDKLPRGERGQCVGGGGGCNGGGHQDNNLIAAPPLIFTPSPMRAPRGQADRHPSRVLTSRCTCHGAGDVTGRGHSHSPLPSSSNGKPVTELRGA
ncbi:hypothetical protein PR048_017784 [Dryococelus australis]|uniref:Uncharacterized protein n=1 Tax=Dryococelus australis TaxID=614101 RepID=A0ABQ9HB22_9NEOP|nr:hypothetical protein PR048_017784 [Dryococelus australis]